MKELRNFVRLSKYAGERFDLIQAGGGNSSVKLDDGTMFIKESGVTLSDVELDRGYIKVKNQKILEILENKELLSLEDKTDRNKLASQLLEETLIDSNKRPSIEIFMHALLYKYTLHMHPLAVSVLLCRKDWREILTSLFGDSVALVDYRTPGAELAIELKNKIEKYQKAHSEIPKVAFLQNHGLIVSSEDFDEIPKITEDILEEIEEYLKLNLKKYKLTNKISALVNFSGNSNYIAYLSSDIDLNRLIKRKKELFFNMPACPDRLVYCGVRPLEINSIKDRNSFIEYQKEYSEAPRVVIYRNHIFFIAENLKKAREIEEVFKFGVLSLRTSEDNINFLGDGEISYLRNWEAEKYRQRYKG